MRVFVAGASGVVGRLLVPMLLGAGHDVVGTTRSPDRAARMKGPRLEMLVVDMFDAEDVRGALVATSPDLVIDQLTDLAGGLDDGAMDRTIRANARLRREATANLVSGMLKAHVPAIVAQSIAWAYAPGRLPHDEDDPLDERAEDLRKVTVGGILALEEAVLRTGGVEGTVLRYGHLYGGDTGTPVPDEDCPVHVEAAAHAALLAATHGAPGRYNIAEAGSSVSSARAEAVLGWSPSFRIANRS